MSNKIRSQTFKECYFGASQIYIESPDFFFFLSFCRTHTHVLFWGHWFPCFGFLVTSPLGFKARVGSALFAFWEANVMYIPQDPPLVLHMPTSWQSVCHQSCPPHTVARWGCRDSKSCSQNICWVRCSTNWAKPGPTSCYNRMSVHLSWKKR